MSIVDHALELAGKGFYIFPIRQNGKKPVIEDFPTLATRDSTLIKKWWNNNPCFNIGIYTGRFNGNDESLLGIDIDVKEGKKGDESFFKLELEGVDFPKTFTQITPSNGKHIIYKTTTKLKNSQSHLGKDIDTRAVGGYLVGKGSIIDGKAYGVLEDLEILDAPEQLINLCQNYKEKSEVIVDVSTIDQDRASTLAINYLKTEAPIALQGDGGDQTTFVVAARLKDFGLSVVNAFNLLSEFWNERCEPPWNPEQLQDKVRNAYKYGTEFIGSKNPQVIFSLDKNMNEEKEKHASPILELNKEYAFIVIKGKSFILQEEENKVEFLIPNCFHDILKSKTLLFNDKKHQLSNIWMASQDRRSYKGLCFAPEQKAPENYYNLWKGFSVEEKTAEQVSEKSKDAVKMFLDHVLENICQGDEKINAWLIAFFAHLIQKPWEKPHVSIVLRGKKGVGKNAFIDKIGYLLKNHYDVASDPRYLLGNFNAHLEKCLLFVLDEAFWSGDKKAEGRLKDLITGDTHMIERKGSEAYSSKNLTRVVILGNEEWLVPASADERRFAVLDVGESKKNNKEFFRTMKAGLLNGGYSYLLHYLKTYDFKNIDIDTAPNTKGLIDQKINSLGNLQQYWFECLRAGRFLHCGFDFKWLENEAVDVEKEKFRDGYRRFVKDKNSSSWIEPDNMVGKIMKKISNQIKDSRKQVEGTRMHIYRVPSLKQARKDWDDFMDHSFDWDRLLEFDTD